MLTGKYKLVGMKYGNREILGANLNGEAIQIDERYTVDYTIDAPYPTVLLATTDYLPTIKLPDFDDSVSGYNPASILNYTKIRLIMKDGSVLVNPDIATVKAIDVASIKIWYPVETEAIKFSNSRITKVNYFDVSNLTTLNGVFYKCSLLTDITGITKWETGNVTDMRCMFQNCTSLTSLDLSGWDLRSVNGDKMGSMFSGCTSLRTLNVSNWDTSRIISLSSIFENCTSLTTITGIKQWDTRSLLYTTFMFRNCSSLNSLDLTGWNTSSLESTAYMFSGCSSLSQIELFNWETYKLQQTNYMFYNCSSLGILDLSSWNIGSLYNIEYMLYGCSSLSFLDLSTWNTSGITRPENAFYLMSTQLEWMYTGSNYSGWELTEEETGYGSTFPWNESE